MHYLKRFRDLDRDEIIAVHLEQGGGPSLTTDFLVESTLRVILRETCHCLAYENSKNIMPCLGAFALLDQIGNCYARSDMASYPDGNASGIKKALYYFAGFGANDKRTKALYAFRNALMHNASLQNERAGVYYSFRYDLGLAEVLALAERAWDGNRASLGDDTITLINPRKLVDLVDVMVGSLNDRLRAGALRPLIPTEAIISRYLLLAHRTSP